ncbi:hypothetical protein [Pseudomonas sp. KNUC1026]|uniref:hypothetical protein n=1 Tax=Pseudomonas sp. KNUC1026 TaxID=2893890 RepID=UPI001F437275|nr:hypothetical protein [Pseudomonas sp. KNUC1026]UFH51387.1 hypothetical protein LN139_10505 [Pseudomonas sp. KNUC1026]
MLALVLGAPLLSGCSSPAPTQWRYVLYDDSHVAPQADYSGLTKFTLARSLLLVQPPSKPGGAAEMLSVPAEALGAGTHYGFQPLAPAAPPQLTTYEGTRLVHSLVMNANPAQRPQAPVTVTAAQNTAAEKGQKRQPALPLAVDTQRLMEQPDSSAGTRYAVLRNAGNSVAIRFDYGAVPSDAIATAKLDLARASGVYFHSACRTATLTFLSEPLKQQQFTVTVADPNFVQTVALDGQLQLTSHAGCGVDQGLKGEDGATLAALNQNIAQARTLAHAWATQPTADQAQAMAQVQPAPRAASAERKAVAAAKAAAQQRRQQEEAVRSSQVQQPAAVQLETFRF